MSMTFNEWVAYNRALQERYDLEKWWYVRTGNVRDGLFWLVAIDPCSVWLPEDFAAMPEESPMLFNERREANRIAKKSGGDVVLWPFAELPKQRAARLLQKTLKKGG